MGRGGGGMWGIGGPPIKKWGLKNIYIYIYIIFFNFFLILCARGRGAAAGGGV